MRPPASVGNWILQYGSTKDLVQYSRNPGGTVRRIERDPGGESEQQFIARITRELLSKD